MAARGTDIRRESLAACTPDADSWAGEPAGRIPAVVRPAGDDRLTASESGPLRPADVAAACRQRFIVEFPFPEADSRRHILSATRREFETMGKVWTEPAPAV